MKSYSEDLTVNVLCDGRVLYSKGIRGSKNYNSWSDTRLARAGSTRRDKSSSSRLSTLFLWDKFYFSKSAHSLVFKIKDF